MICSHCLEKNVLLEFIFKYSQTAFCFLTIFWENQYNWDANKVDNYTIKMQYMCYLRIAYLNSLFYLRNIYIYIYIVYNEDSQSFKYNKYEKSFFVSCMAILIKQVKLTWSYIFDHSAIWSKTTKSWLLCKRKVKTDQRWTVWPIISLLTKL